MILHSVLYHHAGSGPTDPSAGVLLKMSSISSCATLTHMTAHCRATLCGNESSREVRGSSACRSRAVQYRDRIGLKRSSLTYRKLEKISFEFLNE